MSCHEQILLHTCADHEARCFCHHFIASHNMGTLIEFQVFFSKFVCFVCTRVCLTAIAVVRQWRDERSNKLHGLHRCAAIFAHGRTLIIIANSSVDNLRLSWLLCSCIQAENQLFTLLFGFKIACLCHSEMHEKRALRQTSNTMGLTNLSICNGILLLLKYVSGTTDASSLVTKPMLQHPPNRVKIYGFLYPNFM